MLSSIEIPETHVFVAPAASRISTCLLRAHLRVAVSSGWKLNVTRIAGEPQASFKSGSNEMLFCSWGRELTCPSVVMVWVKYVLSISLYSAPHFGASGGMPCSAKLAG